MLPAQPQQAHQHVALSIVSTLYCSKKYIREFCTRSAAVAERLVGHDYEIVLVNDGSPDESLGIAIDLARHNPQIVVVDLSRELRSPQSDDDGPSVLAWTPNFPDGQRSGRGSRVAR